ncbi:MAG: hypothetical protein GHCLOJNM_00536 [bacterium]|nr:hypothetical protein [bacterium]
MSLVLFAASLTFYFYWSYNTKRALGDLTQNLLTSKERASIERFLEAPLEIPAEWGVIQTRSSGLPSAWRGLSPELEEFSKEVPREGPLPPDGIQRMTKDPGAPYLERLNRAESLSESDWERVAGLVSEASSFVRKLESLANVPDYTVDILSATPGILGLSAMPHRKGFEVGLSRTALAAHLLAHKEDWERAFGHTLTLLKLARREPTVSRITHLLSYTAIIKACTVVHALAQRCQDAEPLRAVLGDLGELQSQILLPGPPDPVTLDVVSSLRNQLRAGKAVDLTPGKPGRYYVSQMEELRGTGIAARTLQSSDIEIFVLSFLFVGGEEFSQRADEARVVFDLTRLAIALRIEGIEGGTAEGAAPDIQTYFPQAQPTDPFTNSPYLWDSTARIYYSPGPDWRDDRRATRYTPSSKEANGGDIWLGGFDFLIPQANN